MVTTESRPLLERIAIEAIKNAIARSIGAGVHVDFDAREDGIGLGIGVGENPPGKPRVLVEGLRLSGGLSARIRLDGLDPADGLQTELFGGFIIGLTHFAVTLLDGRLAAIAIVGRLVLPFFTDNGRPVSVGVNVSLRDDGLALALAPVQGNRSAMTPDGMVRLPCRIAPDASLTLTVASLEMARQSSDNTYRLVLSGRLDIETEGLAWPSFELKGLRFDSRGRVEIDGGWIDLPSQAALDFFGFHVGLKKIGFGRDETGRWIGFDGEIRLVEGIALGGSVRGLRLRLDGVSDSGRLSFDGVGINFEIPEIIDFAGEVNHIRAQKPDELGSLRLPLNVLPANFFWGKVRCRLPALRGLEVSAQLAIGSFGGVSAFFLALDAEFPVGVPIFSNVSLYGLRGLFASNLRPAPESFWDWYKFPSDGILVRTDREADFTGSDAAKWIGWPRPGTLAIGAGATIGTSADDGYTASAAITLVLMLPGPVIQFIGKANIISKRTSGRNADAAFDAFACYDANAGTFDLSIHARYGIPLVLDIEAQADLHIDEKRGWYLAIGLPPRDKRVRARVLELFESNAYFVASDQGLVTGTWTGYQRSWDFGPLGVSIDVFIASLFAIQWSPIQLGGGMQWHGECHLSAFGIGVGIGIGALIEGTAPDPFWIHGQFHVELELPWPLPDVGATIDLSWGTSSDAVPPAPLALSCVEALVSDHAGVSDRWTLLAHRAGTPIPQSDKHVYDRDQPGLLVNPKVPRGEQPEPGDPTTLAAFAPLLPQDSHFALTFSQPVHDRAAGDGPGFQGAETDENILRSGHTAVATPPLLPKDDLSDLNPNPPAVQWTYRHTLLEVGIQQWTGTEWRIVSRMPKPSGIPDALDLPGVWPQPRKNAGNRDDGDALPLKPNTLLKLVPYRIMPGRVFSARWAGEPRVFSAQGRFTDQGLHFIPDSALAPAEIAGAGLVPPCLRFIEAQPRSGAKVSIMFPEPVQLRSIESVQVGLAGEFQRWDPPAWFGDGKPLSFVSTSPSAGQLFTQTMLSEGVTVSPLIRELTTEVGWYGTFLAALEWQEPDVRMAILPSAPAFYALKIVTSVEAARVGPGEEQWQGVEGGDRIVEYAYFQTASGPGTATIDDGQRVPPGPLPAIPIRPPYPKLAKDAESVSALGLSPASTFPRGGRLVDLTSYVQWSRPADGGIAAYPGYDLSVEFNETYVNVLYEALGGGNPDLGLHLRVVDPNERHIAVDRVASRVPTAGSLAAVVGQVWEASPPDFLREPGDAPEEALSLWPATLRPATRYTADIVPYALRGRVTLFDSILYEATASNTLSAIKQWHRFENGLPSLFRFQFSTSRYRTFTEQMSNAIRQIQQGMTRRYRMPLDFRDRPGKPETRSLLDVLASALTAYHESRGRLEALMRGYDPLSDDLAAPSREAPDLVASSNSDRLLLGDAGLALLRTEVGEKWKAVSEAATAIHQLIGTLTERPDFTGDSRPPPETEISLLEDHNGGVAALYLASPEPLAWQRLLRDARFVPVLPTAPAFGSHLWWNRDGTRAFLFPVAEVVGSYSLSLTFRGDIGPEAPCITLGGQPVREEVSLGPIDFGNSAPVSPIPRPDREFISKALRKS